MKLKINNEKLIFLSIIFLTISVFSFILFGITGLKIFLGIIFVSFPFYLILGNFDITEGELFVFSLLLGITLLPSLAYLIGLIVSFRIAIFAAFIVFIGVAFAIKKMKNKK